MKKQNDKTWLQIIISGPRLLQQKKLKELTLWAYNQNIKKEK